MTNHDAEEIRVLVKAVTYRPSLRGGLDRWYRAPGWRAAARLTRPAAAALLALVPAAALADALEDYLPGPLPGFATAPGVTVASRARPELEPPGVHLGDFLLHGDLAETLGFDSNPSARVHPRASPVAITGADVRLGSDWGRDSLGAALSVDALHYPDLHEADQTNYSAAIGGTLTIGRADTLRASFTHSSLSVAPNDLSNPGLSAAVPFTLDDVQVGTVTIFNRLSLEPRLDLGRYRFDAGAGTASQAYRNRDLYQPTLIGRYELAPQRDIVVVAREISIDYLTAQPGQARRNSTGYAVLAGVAFGDSLWQSRALVGYQARYYASRHYDTIAGPVAEAGASWTPGGMATWSATLSRSIEDAAQDQVAGFTLTGLALEADLEVHRDLLVHLTGSVQQADYAQGGGRTRQFGLGSAATWRLNRSMSLTGSVSLLDSRSSQNASYSDSVFLLQLGFRL